MPIYSEYYPNLDLSEVRELEEVYREVRDPDYSGVLDIAVEAGDPQGLAHLEVDIAERLHVDFDEKDQLYVNFRGPQALKGLVNAYYAKKIGSVAPRLALARLTLTGTEMVPVCLTIPAYQGSRGAQADIMYLPEESSRNGATGHRALGRHIKKTPSVVQPHQYYKAPEQGLSVSQRDTRTRRAAQQGTLGTL